MPAHPKNLDSDSWTRVERELSLLSKEQPVILTPPDLSSSQPAAPVIRLSESMNVLPFTIEGAFTRVHSFVKNYPPLRVGEADAFALAEIGEAIQRRFARDGLSVSVQTVPVPKGDGREVDGVVMVDIEQVDVLEVRKGNVRLRLRVQNGQIVPI